LRRACFFLQDSFAFIICVVKNVRGHIKATKLVQTADSSGLMANILLYRSIFRVKSSEDTVFDVQHREAEKHSGKAFFIDA